MDPEGVDITNLAKCRQLQLDMGWVGGKNCMLRLQHLAVLLKQCIHVTCTPFIMLPQTRCNTAYSIIDLV